MGKFRISERYRLELHWSQIKRPEDGIMVLKGAYFSGPVLSQTLELNDNDTIRLDFCTQYSILVNNYYVADLSWSKVEYSGKTIKLYDAVIKYKLQVDKAANIKDSDYLVMDTANHELSVHRFNSLYTTYIINDADLVDYGRK
jgi:hypothetical protein